MSQGGRIQGASHALEQQDGRSKDTVHESFPQPASFSQILTQDLQPTHPLSGHTEVLSGKSASVSELCHGSPVSSLYSVCHWCAGEPHLLLLLEFTLLFTYVHVYCVGESASRGQKRTSNSWELEVWMRESYHVNARNQTRVLLQSSQCSQPLSDLSSPRILIFNQRTSDFRPDIPLFFQPLY